MSLQVLLAPMLQLETSVLQYIVLFLQYRLVCRLATIPCRLRELHRCLLLHLPLSLLHRSPLQMSPQRRTESDRLLQWHPYNQLLRMMEPLKGQRGKAKCRLELLFLQQYPVLLGRFLHQQMLGRLVRKL